MNKMNPILNMISILKSKEYQSLLSCVAKNKDATKKIKTHVLKLKETSDELLKICIKFTKNQHPTMDVIFAQLECTNKFGQLSSDADYLRFVISHCPEEFIKNTISVATKASLLISNTLKMLKDLEKMEKK
jgi:hypothetical protein